MKRASFSSPDDAFTAAHSRQGFAHAAPEKRRHTEIKVQPHGSQGEWQLVHPHCAQERQEDLEEVQQMLDAGEIDIAIRAFTAPVRRRFSRS